MTNSEIEHMWKVATNNPNHDTNWHDEQVIKFARLIAAKECEALVLLLRNLADDHTPTDCADMICALQSLGAIRARGDHDAA